MDLWFARNARATRKIKKATQIANPGCYATAISVGLMPLIPFITNEGLKEITVVAASGTTGAGRSLKNNLLASEVMGSLSAYKVGEFINTLLKLKKTSSGLRRRT